MGDVHWKDQLRNCFDGIRILAKCRDETQEQFEQFCEFIAEPAFENLIEELKQYRVAARYVTLKKSRDNSVRLRINFPRSRKDHFYYIIVLPKNSVELRLKLVTRGRKRRKTPLQEKEEFFMKGISPLNVMKLDKEDVIGDIIEHYRNFNYEAFSSSD